MLQLSSILFKYHLNLFSMLLAIFMSLFLSGSLAPSFAAPAANKTALNTKTVSGWVSAPSTRGTGSLLYTCVCTISLCVYTAPYLNTPPLRTTWWRGLMRKAI